MQTFLSTILLFFAFLLLLTGCNPSPSARLESKEKEKPSLPANLSEVDLCGTEKTTEAYLKNLAENKGILGVTKYLDANLNGPTALHICDLVAQKKSTLRSSYIYLQSIDTTGKPIKMLREWGDKRHTKGIKTWRINIYGSKESFGIGVYYVP